jgi:diguanylate cyclase (GGDEF)-like protein
MGLSWLIGASFTMLAMAFLRNTRDQQIKIAILNRQLEETNKLVRSQAERLAQQAREDSLTGLYNRRYMEYDLPREFERARRFSKPLSLAVIDVDYFKQVNDRFSHQVGDQVLVELAEIFRQHTRTSIDSVVRYGGEEFIIYFPETSLEVAAGNICERIRHLVEKHNWEKFSPGLSVTLSIGVAEASYLSDYKELINEADTRLYEAKQSGRNKVCFIEATPVKE